MKLRPLITLLCLLPLLAACQAAPTATSPDNLLEAAAAQATQIIQQAQATALVLEAQSQATALVAQARLQPTEPPSQPDSAQSVLPSVTPLPSATPASTYQVETPQAGATQAESDSEVVLLGVKIATEGYLIEVDFLAPPHVAGSWYQGVISVTDETTGIVYNEIPVMPVVGPLFGKPVEEGQRGYVMLVNAPVPLRSGALVTVQLGEYIFTHVPVQ